MSKKNKKRGQELPQTGNAPELPQSTDALEVPNYVIPTTDLESKQTVSGTQHPAAAQGCADPRSRTETCGKACRN